MNPFLSFLFLLASLPLLANLTPSTQTLFIGTTGRDAEGIYRVFFNEETGGFSNFALAAEINSPGFLTLHPSEKILYAVASWQGESGVIGYRVSENSALTEFTRMSCPDGRGCHLAVHPSGKFLLTAQYGGGSVALFPLNETGHLNEPFIHRHQGGSGVFPKRQNAPHPHWCGYSPCGNFALVPDLGLDQIIIYRVDPNEPKVHPHGVAHSQPGAGPRHMRFSTDEKFIFLLNELSLSVETFAWDKKNGQALPLSLSPTLDEQEKAGETFNSAAEILTHPSGQWIYSSNRGHDTVSVFKTNQSGTTMPVLQKHPIRGAFPRNICLSPSSKWLLAAGQDSHTISAHQIDLQTGKLTYQRGSITQIPSPICLLFVRR